MYTTTLMHVAFSGLNKIEIFVVGQSQLNRLLPIVSSKSLIFDEASVPQEGERTIK